MKTSKLFVYFIFLSLPSCTPDVNVEVPGNINVTTNTAQNGMIQGKVVVNTIDNNLLVLKGIRGATVEVLNTNFSITTSENGIFAIDGIPTGSYSVRAKWSDNFKYESATQSVVVTRQSVSTVPDIELKIGSKKLVIYGKVFYKDKVTPFSNKGLKIETSGHVLGSTTTSASGEYGFDIDYTSDGLNKSFTIITYENNTSWGANWTPTFIGEYPHGIINSDAYFPNLKK